MSEIKIYVEGLSKSLGKKQIIENCSFLIEQGSIFGIHGRFPQLDGIHFSQSLVALDGQPLLGPLHERLISGLERGVLNAVHADILRHQQVQASVDLEQPAVFRRLHHDLAHLGVGHLLRFFPV